MNDEIIAELKRWKESADQVYEGCMYDREFNKILSRLSAEQGADKGEDIVLWEGLAKVGEPDFVVKNGRGDNESVCLVPVPYKLIKGHSGQLIFRPTALPDADGKVREGK